MYKLPVFAALAEPSGFYHGCSTAKDGNLGFGFDSKGKVVLSRSRFTRAVHPAFHLLGGIGMVPMRPGREESVILVGSSRRGLGMVAPLSGPFSEGMIARHHGRAGGEEVGFLFVASGDCPIILLCDPVTRVFAIVHAGRESSVRGIVRKAINLMIEVFWVRPANLIAGICPGIRQESYVLQTFAPASEARSPWQQFCKTVDGGLAVDLIGYNRHLLVESGVKPERIDVADVDTFTDRRFASYRRSKATGEPDWRHGTVLGFVAK